MDELDRPNEDSKQQDDDGRWGQCALHRGRHAQEKLPSSGSILQQVPESEEEGIDCLGGETEDKEGKDTDREDTILYSSFSMVILKHKSELHGWLFCLEVVIDEFPVDELGEGVQVLGTSIPVVNVVGVLPDIDCEEWVVATCHWVSGIARVDNRNFSSLFGKPSPARSKVACCLSVELLVEVLDGSPLVYNGIFEVSTWLSCLWRQTMPVEGMVPVLGSIVEHLSIGPEITQNGTS